MMWREGGGAFFKGDSIGARLLRVIVYAFLAGGVVAMMALAARFLGAARAEEPLPVERLGGPVVVMPVPEEPPLLSGALIMEEMRDHPHAFEAGWKGRKVCDVLQETAEFVMARCTFRPGVGHERHWHGPHLGYVVAGSTMRIADDKGTSERKLKTGDSWKSDGVVHEALNIGGATAVYIIVEEKEHAAKAAKGE